MAGHIGILGWPIGDIRSELKRAALFCDQIALKHLHSESDCNAFPEALREIRWLYERGVVVEAPEAPYDTTKHPWLASYPSYMLTDPHLGVKIHLLRMLEVPGQPPRYGPLEPTDQFKVRHYGEVAELYTRVVTTQLLESGQQVTPLLSRSFTANVLSRPISADTVTVILDQLPLPDAETPIEAVMEWRGDPDAKQRLVRLRVWLNRALRQRLTSAELRDELELALADYNDYMILHHKKMSRGRFEIVCSAIVDVLEALPKIKLSPLLDVVFHSERSKLQLAEVEMKAPGRELAYILRTREHFGNR